MKAAFILILIFGLLSACQPKTPPQSHYVEPQCLSDQSICDIDTELGKFNIHFNVKKVQAEVPFVISISAENSISDLNFTGYFEGKDMFMGKVPVFFQHQPNKPEQVTAESLLASCSEDVMTWRIWITVIKSETSIDNKSPNDEQAFEQSKVRFFVDFTSSRY